MSAPSAYNPVVLDIPAAEATDHVIPLALHTDRHQFLVGVDAGPSAADIPFVVAAPAFATKGEIPEVAVLNAKDFAAPLGLPANLRNNAHFIVTGILRYARVNTTGAAIGKVVRITYQPLPPTSL